MEQWGVRRRAVFIGSPEENESQVSSTIVEQNIKNENETVTNESGDRLLSKKRKHLSQSQFEEVKAAHLSQSKIRSSFSRNKQKNHENIIERWSTDRYNKAEERMFVVMKDLGASFTNPVSRPVLRKEARKHIGDTGLLDHLLKQMDGKVTPCGNERFKRCFNTSGIMEYWLESVDLLKARREAGVQDPYWIPPYRLMPGGSADECSVSAAELLELKAEMTKMKGDMKELVRENQEEEQVFFMKELATWRAETEGRLNDIAICVKSVQGMLSDELMTWKTKVDQQLAETKTSLSSLRTLKQYNAFSSPAYRWDECFDTNLDNFKGDEVPLWFEDPDPNDCERKCVAKEASSLRFNHGDNPTQHIINGKEQELVNHQSGDLAELIPKKEKEEQAVVTPDSSANDNSKPDFDTSLLMLQELFDWKPKIERQLDEMSKSLKDVQAANAKERDHNLIPYVGL